MRSYYWTERTKGIRILYAHNTRIGSVMPIRSFKPGGKPTFHMECELDGYSHDYSKRAMAERTLIKRGKKFHDNFVPEITERLWWMLYILTTVGGRTHGSGNGHDWIDAFCDDELPDDPHHDTLNRAIRSNLITGTVGSGSDVAMINITKEGRDFVTTYTRSARKFP